MKGPMSTGAGGRALVTGAGAGLGAAMVEWLVQHQWQIVAVDRDGLALDALVEKHGAAVIPLLCDLSSIDDVSKLNSCATADSERFDLVAHNAGISATGKFEEIGQEAHQRLLAVNTHAPIRITNALLKAGSLNHDACLLFVSSLSQAVGYPGAASYAASKDAIASYGASLGKKLKKHGVHVSVAFPGPLRTDHAARHAPAGADASKRMTPDIAASKILMAARNKKTKIYPGGAAKVAGFAGKLAPGLMAKMMRRVIYDKLDKQVAD